MIQTFQKRLSKEIIPRDGAGTGITALLNRFFRHQMEYYINNKLPGMFLSVSKRKSSQQNLETCLAELNDFFESEFNNQTPCYRVFQAGRTESLIHRLLEDTNSSKAINRSYFIADSGAHLRLHKELQPYLEKRLDQWLSQFVYQTILSSTSASVLQEEARIARSLGMDIIQQLSRVENQLVELFTGHKKIVSEHYCIHPELVPENLKDDVFSAKRLKKEWQRSGIQVIDTRYLSKTLKCRLLDHFDSTDIQPDGLLIRSDNVHALHFLKNLMPGSIRCVYIDPPFNTGNRDFLYADTFTPGAWCTMMDNRLELSRDLMTEDASIYVHIDSNEKDRLRLLLDRYFHVINEIIWRIGWVSGYKSRANKYIRNHDTIYYCGKSEKPLFHKTYLPYPKDYKRRGKQSGQGRGYPLEDTWNCSAMDPLHSIQIKSFSKEKVAKGLLTQKNEELLERIIASSTNPGDTVLDYFAGTGTTCAAAHKMGRKWIGVDVAKSFDNYLLSRMKRCLAGDPFGISKKYNYKGGGWFRYIELESLEAVLERNLSE